MTDHVDVSLPICQRPSFIPDPGWHCTTDHGPDSGEDGMICRIEPSFDSLMRVMFE